MKQNILVSLLLTEKSSGDNSVSSVDNCSENILTSFKDPEKQGIAGITAIKHTIIHHPFYVNVPVGAPMALTLGGVFEAVACES